MSKPVNWISLRTQRICCCGKEHKYSTVQLIFSSLVEVVFWSSAGLAHDSVFGPVVLQAWLVTRTIDCLHCIVLALITISFNV